MDFIRYIEKKADLFRVLILGSFLSLIIFKLLYLLPGDITGYGIDIWVYTDWLIDYSRGFVRRGLSGELINLFSPYFHPRLVIGSFVWLLFLVFAAGYLRLILKSFRNLSPVTLAGLLFLPSLPLFYIYDHDAFGRTESIGFLILLWHLYILEKSHEANTKQYIRKLLPISLAALPIHILIHESSFFLFIPAHILLSFSFIHRDDTAKPAQNILFLLLLYLPVFLSFSCIIFLGQPSLEVAAEICRHWEMSGALKQGSCTIAHKNPAWALPGSFTALAWSISQAVALPMSLSVQAILTWLLLFSVLGSCTIYLGNKAIRTLLISHDGAVPGHAKPNSSLLRHINLKYFLIPLISSMPLYILGWDFGRWFAVISINYVLIALSKEVVSTENECFSPVDRAHRSQTSSYLHQQGLDFKTIISTILLVTVMLIIRLPHCCISTNMLSESVRNVIVDTSN